MVKVTIGGKEHEVPELNFIALERAWPFIERVFIHQDPITVASAALSVMAAGMMEADNFKPETYGINTSLLSESLDYDDQVFAVLCHQLKKMTKAGEIENIRVAFEEVIKEAGLEVAEGEAIQQLVDKVVASRSTETAPTLSPSSSPQDAREAAGTE